LNALGNGTRFVSSGGENGLNGGCRAFISDHPQFVQRLEMNSSNIITDLDSPVILD